MNENIIDTSYITIYIEEGIMHCNWKTVNVDLQTVKIMISDRVAFSKGRTYPCIVDISKLQSVTQEARNYIASAPGAELMNACAILTGSPLTKLLGNFWMRISKPIIPNKIFTTEKEAKDWLKQYQS